MRKDLCLQVYIRPLLLLRSPPSTQGQETATGKAVYLACGEVCGGDTKVFPRMEGTPACCSSYIMPTSPSAHYTVKGLGFFESPLRTFRSLAEPFFRRPVHFYHIHATKGLYPGADACIRPEKQQTLPEMQIQTSPEMLICNILKGRSFSTTL